MSHSYKKNPICSDGRSPTPRQMKSIANRSVRRRNKRIVQGWLERDQKYRDELTLDGKSYKKWFCSYDIHDYISRWSKEEALYEYYNPRWFYWFSDDSWHSVWDEYKTEKEFLKYWAKYYRRK